MKKSRLKGKKRRTKLAQVNGKTVLITFPYNLKTVQIVKELDGRRYDPDDKSWTAPFSADNIIHLRKHGFEVIGLEKDHFDKIMNTYFKPEEVEPIEIPGLRKPLYPFQTIGVATIEKKNGRALLADEMGLGKTVQALAWLQLRQDVRPVLIVCPASLKLNWRREAKKWLSGRPRIKVLDGKKPKPIRAGDIIIVNYAILEAWVKELKDYGFKAVITDECHYYKNNSAKRTKAVKRIVKQSPHFIPISGTPILSRPIEIYNSVSLLDPTLFPNYFKFGIKYCAGHHNGFSWDFKGSSNSQELYEKLTTSVMIRRLKKDVLQDLPDKTHHFVPLSIDNVNEYVKAETDFIDFVRQVKGKDAAERARNAEQLAQIEALKQLAVRGKMNNLLEWVSNFLESGEKLVVFGIHKFFIDAIMAAFPEIAVKIDGSTSKSDRDLNVQKFQNDPRIRLFVGNMKAAGVGLTLTAASNVVIAELPWTPGEVSQAIDRLHRIGQKEAVFVHWLLADQTIEDKLAVVLDEKVKVLNAVLDGTIVEEQSLLSVIMNSYYEKSA